MTTVNNMSWVIFLHFMVVSYGLFGQKSQLLLEKSQKYYLERNLDSFNYYTDKLEVFLETSTLEPKEEIKCLTPLYLRCKLKSIDVKECSRYYDRGMNILPKIEDNSIKSSFLLDYAVQAHFQQKPKAQIINIYNECIKYAEKSNNNQILFSAYSNLAGLKVFAVEHDISSDTLSLMFYLNKSLGISLDLRDTASVYYFKILKLKFTDVSKYNLLDVSNIKESIDYFKKINFKDEYNQACLVLSRYYIYKEDYEKVDELLSTLSNRHFIAIIKSEKEYAKNNIPGYIKHLKESFEIEKNPYRKIQDSKTIMSYYKNIGDTKNHLIYADYYASNIDSLHKLAIRGFESDNEYKFQNTKNTEKINQQNIKIKEAKIRNTRLTLILLSMVTILLSILFFYLFFRLKSKNKNQENIIIAQNIEIRNSEDLKNILILQIQKVLEDNYSDIDFTSEKLASSVYMSKASFYRKVSKVLNITPAKLISEFRMNKAKKLIESGQDISEVGILVGFKTQKYFESQFKKSKHYTNTEH